MSKLVAFAAIQGGYNVVSEVEGLLRNALATYSADTKVDSERQLEAPNR